jgi:hydroxyethylthiazole kinase
MQNRESEAARISEIIAEAVRKVRETTPLAPSITNAVTIDYVANAQLAVGGSAAMVHMPDEGEFIAQAGGAVYLNVGTLMPIISETMTRTARALQKSGTPWVIDPVAIGIGSMRTDILLTFGECRPSIVRCNASEAIALAKLWGLAGEDAQAGVRGVDSTDEVDSARAAAVAIARHTGGAVAVSGKIDLVTDGHTVARCKGGSELLTYVTGSGCALGGVAAVYAAVTDPFTAALTATCIFNVASSRAAQTANAPGSFKVAFLDELYRASKDPQAVAQAEIALEEA